ncbi:olfactory receptor 11L1-like [Pelobates fuscus]|uniref:olfactory receptor 11L1-like n=1 Tax=Pelobates fuscus TaxID=191477 RepID=UPI002FE48A50
MSLKNRSSVTKFILLGFDDLYGSNIFFFIMFLIIFILTLSGNFLIILLVSKSRHLHSPMYFFLCHLSFSDILLTTNTLPNLMEAILLGGKEITFLGCIAQFYFFSATTITECLMLAVMSYDRYLAICVPLRYTSFMDFKLCMCLSVLPWILGFTVNLSGIIPVSNFQFCDGNVVDHIYCDLSPLQKLSCSDSSFVEFLVFVFSTPIFICPCGFIIMTYAYIFFTIIKIPSISGRQKAFSTCSSHLLVVGAFYGTLITKYMIPSIGHSLLMNKIISLLHTVFTPLFNPIVYSLRNQDIKNAFKMFFKVRPCY